MLGLSDAGAHTSQLCDADFATYLLQHWWRDRRVLTLEKAIWRLTGQPAAFLGLTDRGRLEKGMVADIVVLNPETVGTRSLERRHDLPTGADRLVAPSSGIEHVFVGGIPTRRNGRDLENPGSGQLIRSSVRADATET
jgi:N-acyl-D-aspartate/D-glutamate deacylase